MKTSSLNDYAQRIDRAVQFLTESLEADTVPSLEALADAAALSKYHFHRIFRLMTGETVNDAVRRIRLARGAAAAQSAPLAMASGDAAYASGQSFSRSMRSFTGMTTGEVVGSADINAVFAPPGDSAPLAIEIVSLQPLELIAMRNRGDYADLDAVFGHLFDIAGGPENVEGIYGLYLSDAHSVAPEQCEFVAALQTVSPPTALDEAHRLNLHGGTYFRLRHLGDYDNLPDTLDKLTLAAIERGLAISDAPPLVHYLDDPEETPAEALRCDVHLLVGVNGM